MAESRQYLNVEGQKFNPRVPPTLKEKFAKAVEEEGIYKNPSEAIRSFMADYVRRVLGDSHGK